MTNIGQSCREIYETFSFDNPGDEKNITILRHKFSSYRQHEEQNFDDFVTELKTFSSGCECETSPWLLLIMGLIAYNTKDNSLRESLLRKSEFLDLWRDS